MTHCWTTVAEDFQVLRDNNTLMSQLKPIGKDDAKRAVKDWETVSNNCQKWLDIINVQGIYIPTDK